MPGMLQFTVDESLCTRCGECARDCLAGIIRQKGNKLPSINADLEPLCMKCQHCLAVCPTGAISILGKTADGSEPLDFSRFPSLDQLSHLVRGRRSVRQYKQENVDAALITRILTTLAHVPTGGNACELTFTVMDDIDAMRRFEQKMIAAIRSANMGGGLPERYRPIMELDDDRLAARLFRGAPHFIVASARPDAPCPAEDAALAIANFELLALSAGLGSVWWGFFRMFSTAIPGLKTMLGIPEDHVLSAALFGHPAVHYARTVQKADAAAIRVLSAES